jgi:hypothetical protein
VFRHRIAASKDSSVDDLARDLRVRLDGSKLSPAARALAATEAETVLRSFVDNGRKLAALGSQFEASRDVRGDGYSIHIAYGSRRPGGLLMRLLGRI